MTLETEYNIQDRVHIVELNRDGVVIGFFIDGDGLQYRVRYFDNGKPETVYFFISELIRSAKDTK